MALCECVELLFGYLQLLGVFVRSRLVRKDAMVKLDLLVATDVLAVNEQHLKDLPSERRQGLDVFVHVLFVVVTTNNGVQFELNFVLAAPLGDFVHLFHVLAVASPNLYIGWFIKAIARDGEDVQVLAPFLEPALFDLAAV